MAPTGGSPRPGDSSGSDDEELVRQVLRGDDHGFQALFLRYHRLVRTVIWNYFRQPERVEDLCQDVFLKAYEHLSGLRNGSAFKAWILRLAFRTCVDQSRVHRVRETELPPELSAPAEPAPPQDRDAGEAKVLHLLEGLHATDGMIVWMHYVEGMSFLEIGEILDMTDNNARQHAYRSLQILRKRME